MKGTLISIDEYLHTSYDPDREYIDGEIQERNVGEVDHSRLQMAVAAYLHSRRVEWGIEVLPEVRLQVSEQRFRVPDVCVVRGRAAGRILTEPPFIVIEILSPEDTVSRLMQRVEDYWEFGVRNIWIIDPGARRTYTASGPASLIATEILQAPGPPQIDLKLTSLWQ